MTFLPIVERELRLAARRQLTFWLRVVAALTAVIIASGLFALFSIIPGGIGTHLGGPLFSVLTWMSLAVSLSAGVFFTSDALSEEKREGTLGFLFLTDLRGYDVVFGKLLATSCRCVFALLAIFPVLAGTQLLGGVEGGFFWRTILALLHTLFFSLSCGMFVSAISRHPQKALAGTIVLLFVLTAGGAAVDGLMASLRNAPYRPVLSQASPLTSFLFADENPTSYWWALLISQATGWGLLIAACLLIPRTWQERATRKELRQSSWRMWWRFGSVRRRQHLRAVVLEKNPLTWLASRERWQALSLWCLVILLVAWFIAVTLVDNPIFNWASWWAVNSLVIVLLYLWTASQASQVFADLRRAGWIELILSTPLDFRKVAPESWRGLLRPFGLPLAVVLVVQFLAQIFNINPMTGAMRGGADELLPAWVILGIAATCGLITSAANFIALIWFGLWMGLVSRNSLLATLKTIVFVQIIPWMVISFASAMTFPIIIALSSGFGSGGGTAWFQLYPLISAGVTTVLMIIKDWVFWSLARRRLVENFRATATQAVMPVMYWRVIPPRPTPPNTPPIIPVPPRA